MGQAMAARLLAAGHELMLYNRTPGKLGALLSQGAHEAASLQDAARYSGLVLSMLADDAALESVCRQPQGLLASMPRGGVHIAMGTHDVAHIRALAAAHEQAGQVLLAAPVLGRPEAVAAGRLNVIAGGDAATVERCLPVLAALGARVFRAGEDPGAAAAMKLANNFLLACAIEALGEAFSLVQKSGVERAVFHDMVTTGLFASPAYGTYARLIADQAWDHVGFTVELGLKDINLVLAAGAAAGVPMPSASLCRDRLLGAIAHGDQRRDWSALALEQARASGLA
jgi:3-hydroxyisobutyrate dehydrogenase-like beta-hydroxyacid dehydrogenase